MTSRYERILELRSEIPRLLMLVGDTKSASWVWRCVWPTAQLANHGFIADWCPATNTQEVIGAIDAGRYNTIITPGAYWHNEQDADNWIKYVRSKNLTWIYAVDDNGWSQDIVQRQAKLYETEWGKGEDQLEQERLGRISYASRSDGVIVSTEHLANVTRTFIDKPVWCVPNLIDLVWFDGRI
ncbi:MAG TPA: hypothetical protein VFK47_08070, partial [Ktedonobacteraceae bacterium]|nr:hypothetical protein [Ktedonobacteraceae bacterium]